MRFPLISCLLGLASPLVMAGPYAPAAGQPGSTAIRYDDSRFVAWGSMTGQVVRGPYDISNPDDGTATFGNETTAPVGRANAFDPSTLEPLTDPDTVISLGDGGMLTLLFANPIFDGPSWDFAVFENAFNDTFLELAFVEVYDGKMWVRFPTHSLTQTGVQIDQSSATTNGIDPTNIDGFAGKYHAGWGAPFDLSVLAGTGLDLNHIVAVRVVDVVGSINPAYGTLDSDNHLINDPWPTPFFTGGFDLDAIGVIHSVPEPGVAMGSLIGMAILAFCRRRHP